MGLRRESLRASASQGVGTETSGVINLHQDRFVGCVILVEYESGSGALDVWVQQRLPDDTFDDLARIATLSGAGKRIIRIIASGNSEAAASDVALAVSTVRSGPLGGDWRLKSTVGTSAVTWKASADLYA